jgi:hypothetical protein
MIHCTTPLPCCFPRRPRRPKKARAPQKSQKPQALSGPRNPRAERARPPVSVLLALRAAAVCCGRMGHPRRSPTPAAPRRSRSAPGCARSAAGGQRPGRREAGAPGETSTSGSRTRSAQPSFCARRRGQGRRDSARSGAQRVPPAGRWAQPCEGVYGLGRQSRGYVKHRGGVPARAALGTSAAPAPRATRSERRTRGGGAAGLGVTHWQ